MDLFHKTTKFDRPEKFRRLGLYPYFRAIAESHGGTRVVIDGRELVMAGSNNYLGLTHDERVIEAAHQALEQFGTGCTGSRFLNGTLALHEEFEARLAKFLGKEAAITSATGFQTNLGAIECIAGREDVIFGDRDNHASLIDGCRLSHAKLYKFRHSDVEDLERLLRDTPVSEKGGRLVVTDGVFSMLGDVAPLSDIVEVAKRYGARVMVDDAHALGVVGDHGRGTPELFGVEEDTDLIVGTFSKALACVGGFVAGPHDIIDYIKHTSRTVMFSASMTPASVATVLKCLEIIEDEPERRAALWKNVQTMKRGFEEMGFQVIDGGGPILSVVIGDEMTTMEFNRMLVDGGVFVNPVLPPAAPPGKSLLRTSYMATHTEEDLEIILRAFKSVSTHLKVAG